MRLFEGILILVHIVWFLSFFFKMNVKIKFNFHIAALTFLMLHLGIEGYRLQMGLTYLLFMMMTAMTLVPFFRKNGKTLESRRSMGKSILSALLLIVYTFGSIGLVTMLPVFKLPKPTGSFEVGMNERHLVDEAGTAQAGREMMVQIWYPAKVDGPNVRYEPFPHVEWAGTMESMDSAPRFLFDYLKYGRTNSIKDIAISTQQDKYPILLFSHGYTSTRMQNFSQMEELASHGYIVVSVDHMIDVAFTKFPDGREVMNEGEDYAFDINDQRSVRARAGDIRFVLDHLEKMNEQDPRGLFTGKMDMGRIGMLGHSYGGSTAAQAMLEDTRILAGINMDGPIHEPVASKGLDRPFMFMLNADFLNVSEEEFINNKITYEEFQEEHNKINEVVNFHYKEGIKADTYKLTFQVGDHMSFSDLPRLSPVFSKGVNTHEFHRVMNGYMLAFFNHYVKNEEMDPLLTTEHKVDQFYHFETNRKN